ncbi:MAG TPA: hypothetical protein VJJ52_07820 [Candidatus Nanoarchaeia archaeon]|nr:hypothetical protein [Candidatus Nanoarchaeia archaeon]
MKITFNRSAMRSAAILEADVISIWKDVLKYVRRDLAYIWTDEVKRDFKAMESDVEKILAILEKLNSHYQYNDRAGYNKEIEDINNLILKLEHIEASTECIKGIHQDLKKVIRDVERIKSRRRFIKAGIAVAGAAIVGRIGDPIYDYLSKGTHKSKQVNNLYISSLQRKMDSMKNNKNFPNMNNYVDTFAWALTIDEAYQRATGRNLRQNEIYENLILTIIYLETGFRTIKKLFAWAPVPEFLNSSKGPMQVEDEDTAQKSSELKIILIESIRHLDFIVSIYSQNGKLVERALPFILADWNADPYSCRNAAVQNMLNKNLNPSPHLNLDGNFGKQSKIVLKRLNSAFNLDLDESEIDGINKKNINLFYKGKNYAKLVKRFSEINQPIIADARVLGFFSRIRAYLSSETVSSKEYSEKAMNVYLNIKKL